MKETNLKSYESVDREMFTEMLYNYFKDDLKEELSYERLGVIVPRIEMEMSMFPMYLKILHCGDNPIGFILFQIDTKENSWCIKPGWGFIREMYVMPKFRGRGFGRRMVAFAQDFLKKNAANKIYLTAESAISREFWEKMGFVYRGEICNKNFLPILEREI